MARISATSAWTAFMALSLGSGCTSSAGDPDATTGGAGGSGGSGASSSAVATTSATTASGNPTQCNPAAEPGSIYELTAVSYDIDKIDPVAMCSYRGEVMLISNTAAL